VPEVFPLLHSATCMQCAKHSHLPQYFDSVDVSGKISGKSVEEIMTSVK